MASSSGDAQEIPTPAATASSNGDVQETPATMAFPNGDEQEIPSPATKASSNSDAQEIPTPATKAPSNGDAQEISSPASKPSSNGDAQGIPTPVTKEFSTDYLQGVPTSHLLSEVAASVKSQAPAATSTVPHRATWTATLQAASLSLEPEDQPMVIFPKPTKERQQAMRDFVLSQRSTLFTSNVLPPGSKVDDGLPIRTPFPKYQVPPRTSPAARDRVRELAKEDMGFRYRQPYLIQFRLGINERILPTVSGSLRLRGIDADPDDKTDECDLNLDGMTWDAGCHSCTLTADILPAKFRKYLNSSEHDPYRDASGLRMQVEGYLALSNTPFTFDTYFTIVPASSLPNGRSGVILGQNGLLNRMAWTAVPRIILELRKEDVGDDIWGDIHVSEWCGVTGEHFLF
jgi:hypothetical protein